MPTEIRFVVGLSGAIGAESYTTVVQEFISGVGWMTQQSFSGGGIIDVTGQAKDYADENYPNNISPPGSPA